MRAQYIPEDSRATIMNVFRVPLNVFVCIVLYHVRAFPLPLMFLMCSGFLALAAVLQRRLMTLANRAAAAGMMTGGFASAASAKSAPPAATVDATAATTATAAATGSVRLRRPNAEPN
eukprot:TRINITY_DN14423_c0_g1_i1.p2 TRINITY_DN14423_c0_g1~~TRINITY_DN14423_c0_g1_i1.p2  ORF type:complete len:118 (+),score=9.38 TRINITY_DN14423_c0_g1_i1:1-354(+)